MAPGWAFRTHFKTSHSPLLHSLLEFRQQKVVMKLVNTLNVGEHLRDDVIGKHVIGTILHHDTEMKVLQSKRNISYIIPVG